MSDDAINIEVEVIRKRNHEQNMRALNYLRKVYREDYFFYSRCLRVLHNKPKLVREINGLQEQLIINFVSIGSLEMSEMMKYKNYYRANYGGSKL